MNIARFIVPLLIALLADLPALAGPIQRQHAAVVARKNAGGGGPTLVASDNFDSYANTTDLDDAANWVKEGSATINIVKPASDGTTAAGDANFGFYRHTATFAADQRCEMTLDTPETSGGGFDWHGPAVRVQTGATTGYAVVCSEDDLYLISGNAGTQATIMSDTGMSFSAGNRIAIECSGAGTAARLKVQIDTGSGWVDKWTDVNPAVDIDGGACGIGKWLLSNGGDNLLDDWKGYDLP